MREGWGAVAVQAADDAGKSTLRDARRLSRGVQYLYEGLRVFVPLVQIRNMSGSGGEGLWVMVVAGGRVLEWAGQIVSERMMTMVRSD